MRISAQALTLTAEDAAGSAALEFGGVYRHTAVSVNSTEIVRHAYGFMGFIAELTGRIRAGGTSSGSPSTT